MAIVLRTYLYALLTLPRIGEITLMKDLTKTMDITMNQEEEAEAKAEAAKVEEAAKADGKTPETSASSTTHVPPPPSVSVETPEGASTPADAATTYPKPTSSPSHSPSPSPSGRSTPRPQGIPIRPAIMDKTEEDARLDAAGVTEGEKELREKQKKGRGLTKEQREELYAYEMERKKIRDERVATLAQKLVNRISLWTETDKGSDVTAAFRDKTKLEVENLKMESFGLEILHAIGATYIQKASSFLKSQKFLGVSGFFSRLKDKGTLVKETWGTISTAIDAQMTMEEMAKAEEKGGEDWTDEKKAEYEKRVTGKILAAAWRGSKYEIQGVLRDVCDKVLNDKNVKLEKRVERAQALMVIGEIFAKVWTSSATRVINHRKLIPARPSAIPTRRAISWPSSSSWPKRQRRRRRRKRGRRRRRRSPRGQGTRALLTSRRTRTTTTSRARRTITPPRRNGRLGSCYSS